MVRIGDWPVRARPIGLIWSLGPELSRLPRTRTGVLNIDGLIRSGMLDLLFPRDGEKPEAGRS
jgi:hypothetical protein